jgi:hypothetical protein
MHAHTNLFSCSYALPLEATRQKSEKTREPSSAAASLAQMRYDNQYPEGGTFVRLGSQLGSTVYEPFAADNHLEG